MTTLGCDADTTTIGLCGAVVPTDRAEVGAAFVGSCFWGGGHAGGAAGRRCIASRLMPQIDANELAAHALTLPAGVGRRSHLVGARSRPRGSAPSTRGVARAAASVALSHRQDYEA